MGRFYGAKGDVQKAGPEGNNARRDGSPEARRSGRRRAPDGQRGFLAKGAQPPCRVTQALRCARIPLMRRGVSGAAHLDCFSKMLG